MSMECMAYPLKQFVQLDMHDCKDMVIQVANNYAGAACRFVLSTKFVIEPESMLIVGDCTIGNAEEQRMDAKQALMLTDWLAPAI